MKTVFDEETRRELIERINNLNENSLAQWGKMNVYQTIKHCILADENYLGKRNYKRTFLGRVIGKIALKGMLKDDKPMSRNAPTGKDFKITETKGNLAAEKAKWIASIREYGDFSNPGFVHWFFGKMTKEQVGYFAYKHNDHHLRQFDC
ncbi:DinB family protein [Mucilaginibacter gotjawali]|uniref:Uncharacterized protein n=2 Tax=Mucilaginibacter gotjawali TaxID=1550579 RepID=A0A839SHL3_9SPHI|nr:DinB family protein [Mucilaginibacter gotjawali]MBB3056390.1 hypothetical protein [Mucilaginibacter gotjawali]BAU55097.1 DinB superfamily protein [Mucilaginibacter gotjawali]